MYRVVEWIVPEPCYVLCTVAQIKKLVSHTGGCCLSRQCQAYKPHSDGDVHVFNLAAS